MKLCAVCQQPLGKHAQKYCSKVCYRVANNIQMRDWKSRWQKENRELMNTSQEEYRKKNLSYHASKEAMYRTQKRISSLQHFYREEILKIYEEARHSGLSVDHIVPLRGKLVCGLHVPWNLQIMPLIENIKKGNKYVD